MLDAKVLLRSVFFIDVLSEAKNFSLLTQKSESNINIVDSADSTKQKYERLVNKIRQNNDYIFQLPTLKSVVEEIENDEDGEPRYQNQKIKYYTGEKRYIRDHALQVLEKFLNCF